MGIEWSVTTMDWDHLSVLFLGKICVNIRGEQ